MKATNVMEKELNSSFCVYLHTDGGVYRTLKKFRIRGYRVFPAFAQGIFPRVMFNIYQFRETVTDVVPLRLLMLGHSREYAHASYHIHRCRGYSKS